MPSKSSKLREEDASSDVDMDEPTSHQPVIKDHDADMMEQDDEESQEGVDDYEEEEEPQRVKLLPGSTETAASFEFLDEGHTLGNALRYVIMKNPEVEFCAYAIPHPSEAKMNVRIQTFPGTTAIQALEKGLRDLQELCDVVTEKFTDASRAFAASA